MWFKVSLDKNGNVIACEYAGKKRTPRSGKLVFFIDAGNKATALKVALQAYEREKRARSHAHKIAAGICLNCSVKAESGKRLCGFHVMAQREHHQRKKKVRRDGLIYTPLRSHEAGQIRWRLETLAEVRDKQKKLSSKAFDNWLRDEISSAQNALFPVYLGEAKHAS